VESVFTFCKHSSEPRVSHEPRVTPSILCRTNASVATEPDDSEHIVSGEEVSATLADLRVIYAQVLFRFPHAQACYVWAVALETDCSPSRASLTWVP
jgi:hypothetical protein